jgi:hypothetical protein
LSDSLAHEVTPGIWCWQRRPRGLRPEEFGVRTSYAITLPAETLLVDPLVTGEDDPALSALDGLAAARIRILISKPYHTRSAELLRRRYQAAEARIYGHPEVATRLTDTTGFQPVTAGERGTEVGVARFRPLGRPPRNEQPIEIPALHALVFGDSVVETGRGELRVWEDALDSEQRRRWWEEKYQPTLQVLAALEPEHVLVTHGDPVVRNGAAALARALRRDPWQRPKRRPGPAGH